jgi:hypothetical protein
MNGIDLRRPKWARSLPPVMNDNKLQLRLTPPSSYHIISISIVSREFNYLINFSVVPCDLIA